MEHHQYGSEDVTAPQTKESLKPCVAFPEKAVVSKKLLSGAASFYPPQSIRSKKTDFRRYSLNANCFVLEVILWLDPLQKSYVSCPSAFSPVFTIQHCQRSPGKKNPVALPLVLAHGYIAVDRHTSGEEVIPLVLTKAHIVFLTVFLFITHLCKCFKDSSEIKRQLRSFWVKDSRCEKLFFLVPCLLRTLQRKRNPLWHSVFKLFIIYFLMHFLKQTECIRSVSCTHVPFVQWVNIATVPVRQGRSETLHAMWERLLTNWWKWLRFSTCQASFS